MIHAVFNLEVDIVDIAALLQHIVEVSGLFLEGEAIILTSEDIQTELVIFQMKVTSEMRGQEFGILMGELQVLVKGCVGDAGQIIDTGNQDGALQDVDVWDGFQERCIAEDGCDQMRSGRVAGKVNTSEMWKLQPVRV